MTRTIKLGIAASYVVGSFERILEGSGHVLKPGFAWRG
jgi:hypothetical protein